MSKQLFVGCSFLTNVVDSTHKIKVVDLPGAGNQAIMATVLHELSKEEYDQVYVLWSGINRIDIPIGLDLHNTFDSSYMFCHRLDDIVWYFSGGVSLSGNINGCPKSLQKIFKTFYIGATPKYLADLTLSSIITIQSVLETKKINYQMSFIYDITADTEELVWLSRVLGTLDQTSKLYKLVNWNKVQTTNTPFEWCKQRNLLQDDQFHPTKFGMQQWILENFNLDVSKSID